MQAKPLFDFLILSLHRIGSRVVDRGGPTLGLPTIASGLPFLANKLRSVIRKDRSGVSPSSEYLVEDFYDDCSICELKE